MSKKRALTHYPILKCLVKRWSLYGFQDRPVLDAKLCSIFNATRWSSSSYKEQPWSHFIVTQGNTDQSHQLLSCLSEGKQVWAKDVPVLRWVLLT